MAKLPIRRVFIRDLNGEFFRICGISNPKDHTGEYYLKLVFPDFKGIPLIGETTNKQRQVIRREAMTEGVQEFTYHYHSGIAHYKADEKTHVDQAENLPNLKTSKGLHLIHCVIYTLLVFKQVNKQDISREDILIQHPFNKLPRTFEFSLSSDPDVRMTNIGPHKLVSVSTYALDEPNVYLTICDFIHREYIPYPKYAIQLHRDDDPTGFLRKRR